MGDIRGFLQVEREEVHKRPASERLNDYREFELPVAESALRSQASRCMDCGIPFCHGGCPLGNLIPDFNDHVYRDRLEAALGSLHATNNFPEFTGRVCPAPCEASCVLGIDEHPVTIKNVERAIIDRAWERALVRPVTSHSPSGKRVAVVGSGPAGLAAAQQLARRGHDVTVFERDDRVGGILRYGIPDFKMEKHLIDRRVDQMQKEGVHFRTKVHVGYDIRGEELRVQFDAVVLAGGARKPRDLVVPGRSFRGVHFAMDFLTQSNRRVAGDAIGEAEGILASGKRVVVLGGGDTGSDCVGTSLRQRATSVTSLELLPRPPERRTATNPWPAWPLVLRSSSSHDEGGTRDWAAMTTELIGDEAGRVRALKATRVQLNQGKIDPIPGTEFELECELVLLAMGFLGSEQPGLLEQLGVAMTPRGNVKTDVHGMTNVNGVFAAGDMARGQSLVVWAIAEGRKVADAVHGFLMVPAHRRLPVHALG